MTKAQNMEKNHKKKKCSFVPYNQKQQKAEV